MAIKRYSLFTTVNLGQDINLSEAIDSESARDISRCQIHDIWSSQPIDISCKLNDTFRTFASGASGWNRINLAYLNDIQITGTVNGTTIEIVGSDQFSDT
jgi:hypothetical protein